MGSKSREIEILIKMYIIEGTTQTKAINAIIMIVFKNRFSLRIRISCARLSLEFCKAMFLDCFFNLQCVDEYITDDSMTMITLKICNTLELISALLLPENTVHAGMTQLTI